MLVQHCLRSFGHAKILSRDAALEIHARNLPPESFVGQDQRHQENIGTDSQERDREQDDCFGGLSRMTEDSVSPVLRGHLSNAKTCVLQSGRQSLGKHSRLVQNHSKRKLQRDGPRLRGLGEPVTQYLKPAFAISLRLFRTSMSSRRTADLTQVSEYFRFYSPMELSGKRPGAGTACCYQDGDLSAVYLFNYSCSSFSGRGNLRLWVKRPLAGEVCLNCVWVSSLLGFRLFFE